MNRDADFQLPPGQQLVAAGKWPLVGERSSARVNGPWRVSLGGLVAQRQSWTIDDLRNMPQVELTIDIHCVTRWSKLGARFRGVQLQTLLALAEPAGDARFVSFVAAGGREHSTSLALSEAIRLGALVALDCDGLPLSSEHGGPVRVVVPQRYFYKSLKWLRRVELLAEDRLGYWESEAGYHNHADPWREERYFAPSLTKQQAAHLIDSRDLAGRELRGLDVAGRSLARLNATNALLRDGRFQQCNLQSADFSGANLSNTHFERADLRGAKFADADCEGANFAGADLRGADFTGASLLAASFSPDAQLDHSTRIGQQQIDSLMPAEAAFVELALGRDGSND